MKELNPHFYDVVKKRNTTPVPGQEKPPFEREPFRTIDGFETYAINTGDGNIIFVFNEPQRRKVV